MPKGLGSHNYTNCEVVLAEVKSNLSASYFELTEFLRQPNSGYLQYLVQMMGLKLLKKIYVSEGQEKFLEPGKVVYLNFE
jgi:hypothetical protein